MTFNEPHGVYVSPSGVFDSAWLTYPRSALAAHDRRQGLAIQELDIRAGAPVVGAARRAGRRASAHREPISTSRETNRSFSSSMR